MATSLPKPSMGQLATFARRAALRDPKVAQECLVAFVDVPDLLERVMEAALWDAQMVHNFETRHARAYLIRGRWGQFWLAPAATPMRSLVPHAPIVSPQALVALAHALIAHVSQGSVAS